MRAASGQKNSGKTTKSSMIGMHDVNFDQNLI
jgi:hypothetical protein